jgi:UDP-glucose 4-epimerase
MRLLVTGGAGYIGSITTALLLEAGHDVVVLDDLSTGFLEAVPPGARFVRGRVQDAAEVLSGNGFEGVLHFAGRIVASESMTRPELHWDVNTLGTIALLNAMRSAGVARLVFSSTAAVYGNPVSQPITEAAPTTPTSVYGATKLAADLAIWSETVAHGLAAVSLRYFNVAGADAHRGERHDPETHLIPMTLDVAAGRRPSVPLYGQDYPTHDGTCVRDYIHVVDLARAHLLALDAAIAGRHEVYNLGNGRGSSNLEVVEVARMVTGEPIPVDARPRRQGDPDTLVASSSRARTELGWVPLRTELFDIIADAWEFHRAHR